MVLSPKHAVLGLARRNRKNGTKRITCAGLTIGLGLLSVAAIGNAPAAMAQVVYSSNFASGTSGFTAGGDIASLTTASLPTDAAGINSGNQATWLGEIGANVPKSTTTSEIANLNLSGLTVGKQYSVAFQLFIGASWDGAAVPGQYGQDFWSLTAGSTSLVNTTFSNLTQGFNAGAYSPQNYSPTTYTSALTTDPVFAAGTGAAVSHLVSGTDYSQDYTIYNFGINSGDPVLTFFATSATENLQFQRSSGSTDSADEYWALNNVKVSGIGGSAASAPEPAPIALFMAGIFPVARLALRKRVGHVNKGTDR